jgi:hypothetical protein
VRSSAIAYGSLAVTFSKSDRRSCNAGEGCLRWTTAICLLSDNPNQTLLDETLHKHFVTEIVVTGCTHRSNYKIELNIGEFKIELNIGEFKIELNIGECILW